MKPSVELLVILIGVTFILLVLDLSLYHPVISPILSYSQLILMASIGGIAYELRRKE